MNADERALIEELCAAMTELLTVHREVKQEWLNDTPVITRAQAALMRGMTLLTVRRLDDTSHPG